MFVGCIPAQLIRSWMVTPFFFWVAPVCSWPFGHRTSMAIYNRGR
jgi:hypothetical protein